MHRKSSEGHGNAVLGNESKCARMTRSRNSGRTKTTMAGSRDSPWSGIPV